MVCSVLYLLQPELEIYVFIEDPNSLCTDHEGWTPVKEAPSCLHIHFIFSESIMVLFYGLLIITLMELYLYGYKSNLILFS